VAWSRSCSVLC